ncbi:hypothetical protein Zmor_024866 [Zophobas morio]|uniref:Uncharacterized protein n=1 Tax=Zophobas morio TaxID=2755281 RepID=A0AA38HQH0_9CUCU|nr:hypothetical protein Zmor_024866 [Zophobas morio]
MAAEGPSTRTIAIILPSFSWCFSFWETEREAPDAPRRTAGLVLNDAGSGALLPSVRTRTKRRCTTAARGMFTSFGLCSVNLERGDQVCEVQSTADVNNNNCNNNAEAQRTTTNAKPH